ncbi:MAG: cell division ATP-binding protein FtsE [Candidatus Paceibacterota bacterium]
MIHFDKVSKVYSDDSVALDEVTIKIEPKEFVSIVGHSGAGKTTLVKMILAEERPTRGTVMFESVDIHRLRRGQIPAYRRRIGTIFQDFKLIPGKTVFENIAFAMEAAGRTDAEIESDVPHVLELVDLGRKIWNFPHELSGGERQRVAIARAIVNQPDIVIADEPTGNLDPINTRDIIQILKRINDLGTTVILTTHNRSVIDDVGRRVITLENGKVIRDDSKGQYAM